MSRFGDGNCDWLYNTLECGRDGGDCDCDRQDRNCAVDGYPRCFVDNPSWIGDGICDDIWGGKGYNQGYNTPECEHEGGDCPKPAGPTVIIIWIVVAVCSMVLLGIALTMAFRRLQMPPFTLGVEGGEEIEILNQSSQFSFDPFVSMKFTQVKIVTLLERIIHIFTCLKKLAGAIKNYIPGCIPGIGGFVSVLNICINLLSFIFRVKGAPLIIRIDATSKDGSVKQFLLKDKRPWLARLFNVGEVMELTSLGDEKKVLMRTCGGIMRGFDIITLCCCCCFGPFQQKDKCIAQASGGSGENYVVRAKMSLPGPCSSSCNCPEETSIGLVEVGANAEKELAFNVINDFCSGVGTCCGDGDNVNMIVSPEDGWSRDDYKMMVQRRPDSYCKDFLMEATEMLYEEIMGDEEGGEGITNDAKEYLGKMKDIKDKDFLMEATEMLYEEIMGDEEGGEGITKDAKEYLGKMKDIKDEMEGIKEDKEAFDEMKKKGYKEIKTSCSKWKVEFPSEFTHEEKSAAMLFMSDMMPRALRGENVFKTRKEPKMKRN